MQAYHLLKLRIAATLSAILFVVLPLFAHTAIPLYAAKMAQSTINTEVDWWNTEWPFRVPLQIATNTYRRSNQPVEVALNFTELLNNASVNDPFDPQSLRLVEVAGGNVIDEELPLQFDQNVDYDAATNASGTLIFLLNGDTAADTTRTFHLYFNSSSTAEQELSVPTYPSQVTVTSTTDEGQNALQIQTEAATYFYQLEAGGFSSLLDPAGNDWINYHPEPAESAAGAYRGIPNMVHPEGAMHPGATGHTTTILHQGPLKATIRTTVNTDDDAAQWVTQWEFFPTFARLTVLEQDHDYWFLYEGTPGGRLEPEQDFVVRADGTMTLASEKWVTDLPGEEWLYFGDPTSNRALYLVNHNEDDAIDSYRAMTDSAIEESSNAMTVFGFGRRGAQPQLTEAGNVFTIGLVADTDYTNVAPQIRGIYQPLAITVGAIEEYAEPVSAQIMIIEDAQPNAKQNFRFDGDLGSFLLDDPDTDDGDAYGREHTITSSSNATGNLYTVRQRAARGWRIAAISCIPAAAATVDLPTGTAQITADAGQTVMCTFTNVKEATVRVQRLDSQPGHPVTLYDEHGTVAASGQSNSFGKLSFEGLYPSSYTLCSDDRHTCTPIIATSEQLTLVTIPIGQDAATTTTLLPLEENAEEAIDEPNEETSDDNGADNDEIIEGNGQPTALTAEEIWLNTPIFAHKLYLPYVSATD